MGFARIVVGLLTFLQFGIGAFAQSYSVATIDLLPTETDQSSGIILLNGNLVTHNDGAGGSALFELDPADGTLLSETTVANASNVDWEDICADDQYIYIADIGNNQGDRTDLKVYLVLIQDYLLNIGGTVTVEDTIKFSYSDQVSFVPGDMHDFDAEAIIPLDDSLYIFSKNRLDDFSNIYSLSKTPGIYSAPRVDRIDAQGQISGGTYNLSSDEIMLTGYTSTEHFLVRIANFTGIDFSGGQVDRYVISTPRTYQIEAVDAINDDEYYLTSETRTDVATLFRATEDPPPTIEFTTMSQGDDESIGTMTAVVDLSIPAASSLTIPFTVTGDATQGAVDDYTITSSPLTILAGQSSGNIVMTINDDSEMEPGESIIITLGTPSFGILGTIIEHTATINDNDPPVVTITSPLDGATNPLTTDITFTATVVDNEDLSGNLSWASDIDGNFGTGASFNYANLTTGTHTITASVTDSDGLLGSDNITVNITNTAPTVTINTPADGTAEDFGTDISFSGTSTDTEEGDLSGSLNWSSDLDGSIGSGASFSTTDLTVGTHMITASVTDGGGLEGSNNITVTINNTAPTVTITSPVDGVSENMGTTISFSATASDAEEGDLSAALSWESDLDGVFGSGASLDYGGLSVGTHVVTAMVLDQGALEGNDVIIVNITNTAPVVNITDPSDGTSVEEGTSIMFAATAIDTEEGDLAPGLTWIASLDGGIGSGASISTAGLSVGTQSITASVIDGGGLEGSDAITVTVTAPNAAPTISITAPADGHTVVEGTNINFTGTADDPEQGDLTGIIDWSSDQDGSLGTGGSINVSNLTIGTHTITASVTDSEPLTTTAQITVTITANQLPTIAITDPTDGISVVEDTDLTFTGTANDPEDGDLAASINWNSDQDGDFGTGGSINISTLSINTHTITASVTDSHGETSSATITVTITANQLATVTITDPTDGTSVVEDTDLTFTGTANDPEDGDLTANINWNSDQDGDFGTGGSVNISTLSINTHTITASVIDSHGETGSATITVTITANQLPVASFVSITPVGAITEGEIVTGAYTYSDPENDPQGTSTFSWLRNGIAITGANAQSYTLVSADVGTNIVFEITPVATSGASPGIAVQSPLIGPIEAANSPPTNINLSSTSIAENQPIGTIVGTLTTTDPDIGDTHTYSLVAGNGDNDNGSFQIAGDQLQTSAIFNFEIDNTLNIRIQTEDVAGETFSEAIVINVTDVNDLPVAVDDLNNNTTESTPITIDVTANDTDEDGTIVVSSVVIVTNAADGNAVDNGDGTVTYTPDPGFTGGDSFTYTVEDDLGATSNEGSVVITVGANSSPVANDDLNNTTDEDVAINIDVVANDTDPDGSIDPTTVVILSGGLLFGTAIANNDGTVTYTPNPDATGDDSFTYEVDDNLGATSNVANVTITIDPVNDPPVANDDAASTPEDIAISIDVIFNDTDIEDGTVDPTTVNVVDDPTNGTATDNNDGTITYTPNPAFSGSDSFTYQVRDSEGALSNTATVTVDISSVNDPPIANDDTNNTTEEETSITIDVAANDTDSDGTVDPTTVTIVGNPSNGSLVNNGDGTITYTPNIDFAGSDSFTYNVRDDQGAVSNTATVLVDVTDVNDLPVAVDDLNHTTNEDESIVIDLTSNDFDPDGTINNATINIVVLPANGGSATPFSNGSIRFDPALNFNGIDSLRYTVADNLGGISNTALVVITVNDINDPPVAVNDNATTEEDTSVEIDALSNDTDIDGTLVASSLIIFSNPGNGSVVINPGGTLTYTPNADYIGSDNFTYKVADDDGELSNAALVSIEISDINDPPTANDDVANTDEDQPVIINLVDNDTDIDGTINGTSIVIVTDPSNGSVVVNNDGTVEYTPSNNFNGLDTFNYTVEDDDGALSNIAQVSVSVNTVNDALSANDDDVVTDEDVQILINVIANDVDSDGSIDPTTVNAVTSPVNGTIEVNQDGTVLYKPNQDFFGSDVFTYNVRDDQGQVSNIATVNITINDINDLPIALDDNIVVDEDIQTILNLIDNDSDVDGTITVTGVTLISSPVNGQIDLSGEGVKYTPIENYTGDDVFIYTVTDDDDGISNEATVFLTIRDINDAPSDLILSNTFIHESEPIGTSVGAFTTVDIDPNETFTYSLVIGDGDVDNNAFIIEGDELVTQVNFMQSQQEDYQIRVKTDDGESSLEKTFVISVFSDQNPPFIIPGSLPRYHPITNSNETYSITLEDDFDVDRVLFSYRGITAARDAWTVWELNSVDRFYETIVDASSFDDIGLQYEFIVLDVNGSSINLPGFTYNRYEGNGLDFERIVFGERITDYNLISIPLELDNGNVTDVLEDNLGPYDQTQWRLFAYQRKNLIEYTEGLNTLERGKGYWLIIKDNKELNTGQGSTELFADRAYNLELDQGWTLIGNPYNFNISWSEVLIRNNVQGVDLEVTTYDGGYSTAGVLKSFQGAFVFADRETSVSIPLEKFEAIQGRTGSSPDVNDEENWELDLNLSTSNLSNNLGGLGMRQNADHNKDSFDRIRAPRFLEYLDLNFPKPEYFAPEFSKDIVPTALEHIWEFSIETNLTDQQIKLEWTNSFVENLENELWLYHKDQEVIVNMKDVQHYDFANLKTHNFAVYYGDKDFIEKELRPTKAWFEAVYPNPFTDHLTISFSLNDKVDSEFVDLSVYDLMGRRVKTVWHDRFPSGFYKIDWDGTNSSGNSISSGTYIIRLEINGQKSMYKRVIKK